jgi:hypothetical protein
MTTATRTSPPASASSKPPSEPTSSTSATTGIDCLGLHHRLQIARQRPFARCQANHDRTKRPGRFRDHPRARPPAVGACHPLSSIRHRLPGDPGHRYFRFVTSADPLASRKVIVPSCSSPSSGKLAATKGSSFLINGSVPTFYHALAGSCQSPAAFRPNRAPGQHAPRCVSVHADRQHHLAVRTTASFIQEGEGSPACGSEEQHWGEARAESSLERHHVTSPGVQADIRKIPWILPMSVAATTAADGCSGAPGRAWYTGVFLMAGTTQPCGADRRPSKPNR